MTSGALVRTTVHLSERWELADGETCAILGGLSASTWASWKRGEIDEITDDHAHRMAVLMGIHKGLRYLFREPERGYAWIRKPNAVFAGASALDIMMRGGITDLIDVRNYLNAECVT